jgi:rod shape-determining protein MreD
MKRLVLVLSSVLFLILDNTLLPFFAIKNYYPSLLFLFAVFYSLINGKWEAVWIGVLSGILQDIYFNNVFGLNALTNLVVCLLAAELGNTIFKEKRLIPVVSSFFLSAIKEILVFVFLYILGAKSDIQVVLYNSIYSMVISIFIYKKIYKLSQKHYMKNEWKF